MPIFPTGYTQKTSPHDNDQVLIGDSQASNAIKRTKISSIVAKAVAAAQAAVSGMTDWITSSMLKDGSVTLAKRGYEDWTELARVTASGGETLLDTGTILQKKYLRFRLVGIAGGGTFAFEVRFNNDSAAKYADRVIFTSGSTVSSTNAGSRSAIRASVLVPASGVFMCDGEIMNVAGWTKLVNIIHGAEAGSLPASASPTMEYYTGKYVHTTGPITSVQIFKSSGTGTMGSGSELVVEGRD